MGVSGGLDSAVLLYALAKSLPAQQFGGELRVCHLDHGIRTARAAEEDRRSVGALVARLQQELAESAAPEHSPAGPEGTFRIVLEADEVPRGLIARRASREGGLEAAARKLRYTFFRRVAEETGAPLLFLAHHEDDQLETLLMRVLSGADPARLAAIPARRPLWEDGSCHLLRPLLAVPRSALEAAARAWELPISEDETNEEEGALRNRIRRRALPLLEELLPDVRPRLAATRRRAGYLAEFLAQELRDVPWERRDEEGGTVLKISREELAARAPYLRLQILTSAFAEVSPETGAAVSERFLRPFLVADLATAGEFQAHAYGVSVSLSSQTLTLSPRPPREETAGYLLVAGEADAPVAGVSVSGRNGRHSYAVHLAGDALLPPILLRSRLPGDELRRASGHRTVKRVLIDIGVPREQRMTVPVIEDRRGVLALLGSAVGCEDVLREGVRRGQASPENVTFQVNTQ